MTVAVLSDRDVLTLGRELGGRVVTDIVTENSGAHWRRASEVVDRVVTARVRAMCERAARAQAKGRAS